MPVPGQDGTATLIGYGRLSWDQFLALTSGGRSAWADYDGFHIGSAPASAPPYSHVWAWTGRWLVRARVDGDHVIAGALALASEPETGATAVLRKEAAYQRIRATTWPRNEQRVGQLKSNVTDRPVTLYMVTGANPVTFVALDPEP